MASLFKLERGYQLLDYIFPLYFVIAFFELYLGMFGISVCVKYVSFLILLLYGIKIYINCPNYKGMKSIFTLFLLYNLMSIIWYAINGVTFQCYMNEIFNSIPAMFFFYIGMSDKRKDDRFLRYFLYSCTICMLIGFFLYLTTPSWFLSGLAEIASNRWHSQWEYTESDMASMIRFSSYLPETYEADIFAIFAFGISVAFFYNHKKFYSDKFSYLFLFVNFLAAIMTQQRVAMAAVVCFLVFFLYWGYRHNNKKEATKIISIVAFFIIILIPFAFKYFADRMDVIADLLTGRMENMSMSKALGERSYQLKLLTNHWDNPIFGHGIGAGGSVARSFGHPAVSDCSYIEMLYELGVVGFAFYFFILVKTALRGLKFLRYYIPELCIIGFVAIACIGSNTLTMGFLCVLPFWYCLGRIWNPYLFRGNQVQTQ